MEINHFMHSVSRILPSSFTSCQFRTLPDAVEPCTNYSKATHNLHGSDQFSPKKPSKNNLKNPKGSIFKGTGTNGRRCPPVTPVSASNLKERNKEGSKNGIIHSSSSNSGWFSDEKTQADAETNTFFSLSSAGSCDSFTESSRRKCDIKNVNALGRCSFDHTIFSDQDSLKTTRNSRKTVQNPVKSTFETQKTTKKRGKNALMRPKKVVPESGLEVSDFSAELYYSKSGAVHQKTSRKTRKTNPRRKTAISLRFVDDWTEESYAMEKCSKDPRSDFRASMVEMIVEKQIFGSNDLEKLLHCFLSLNEASYHGIIFDVFTEICETLFCN